MPHRTFFFNYDFRPVGQGLFSSGAIFSKGTEYPAFTWVYDCGSSDSPASVEREIDRLYRSMGGCQTIDVMILSHFDRDHVNGVAQLLDKFRVDRLFLPYIPLTKRLEIALAEPVLSQSFLQFLSDPAAYLVELGGDNLGEVIYITGGGGEGPPPQERGDLPPGIGPEPFGPFIKYPRDEGDEDLDPAEVNDRKDLRSKGKLSVVNHQTPLVVPGMWEFVFYNLELPEASGEFKTRIRRIVDRYTDEQGRIPEPEDFIGSLKAAYGHQFKTSTKRNNISLVAYSGPLIFCWKAFGVSDPFIHSASTYVRGLLRYRIQYNHYFSFTSNEKLSAFYFGDFNLTKTRLQPIIDHFHIIRWSRIRVSQIAHHGAKASWHKDAASKFLNDDSVFSYGLHNTYKHPGKAVLEDFHLHNPILVNEQQGVKWAGFLHTSISG